MVDKEAQYLKYREDFIKARTQQEAWIDNLAKNIEAAPDEIKSRLPKIDHPITLRDFIPALYDEDDVSRKDYAEQLYACNKFIDAWNELVDENDAEAAKIMEEFRRTGIS